MDNLQTTSDKLIEDLISTLEYEIKELESKMENISFKLKTKRAQLRKYQKIRDDDSGKV